VDVRITPEPGPDEREALLAGLERLLAGDPPALPTAYRSAWREAGLREAVGGGYVIAPARTRRGAHRP
jgi:hypothetical protein